MSGADRLDALAVALGRREHLPKEASVEALDESRPPLDLLDDPVGDRRRIPALVGAPHPIHEPARPSRRLAPALRVDRGGGDEDRQRQGQPTAHGPPPGTLRSPHGGAERPHAP